MRASIGKNQEATATITEIYLMVSSMRFCLSPILYYTIQSYPLLSYRIYL